MKELSIIEKAKAHDEAIKKAETLYKASEPMSGCNVLLETLFPELAESKDERIRKRLLEYFEGFKMGKTNVKWEGLDVKDILSWLEKQGDKPAWSEEDKEMYKKVETAINSYYAPFSRDAEEMSEWFKNLKERVQPKRVILEKLEEWLDEYVSSLADVDTASLICSFTNYLDGKLPKSQKPADIYCQEHCKGYQETGRCFADGGCQAKRDNDKKLQQKTKETMYDKPAWSEEGVNALNRISTILVDASEVKNWWKQYRLIERDEMIRLTDFLKSLKDRLQPQLKQEWNEEDEIARNDIIAKLAILKSRAVDGGAEKEICEMEIKWLKSLKDRFTWKPSDEQMDNK